VALERAIADADALLVEDYNKGALTETVIARGMTAARRRGVPIVVDPKFRNFFSYKGATVFKPNRRELEQAMGATLDLAHPDALPAVMVLVTKDQALTRIPTVAREVYDVSGAGDTVTAWVGTALAAGANVREAAQVAAYAAAVEVGKAGVATVAPDELLAAFDVQQDQLGRLRRGGLL
jgi:D-beta-D-heptose 7-phosphate kinase/D-beta-D-heptose 1-phosphate adenosyltransferase